MGNRAIIIGTEAELAIYLHWNGGRDSVEAFLKYAKLQQYPSLNSTSGVVAFTTMISNFFKSPGLSVDIFIASGEQSLDVGDNGVYVVDKNFNIVGRKHFNGVEQQHHKLEEMLKGIDEAQPEEMQLGELLNAEEVPTESVKVGDTVIIKDFKGTNKYEVLSLGEDKMVNGVNVKGLPFIQWTTSPNPDNPNNYVRTKTVRVMR